MTKSALAIKAPCPFRKLNPTVLMMKSAQDVASDDAAAALNGSVNVGHLSAGRDRSVPRCNKKFVAEGRLPILTPGTVLENTMKDVNHSHPFTATSLGKRIGKNYQWVSAAARKLGLREDRRYCVGILGTATKHSTR